MTAIVRYESSVILEEGFMYSRYLVLFCPNSWVEPLMSPIIAPSIRPYYIRWPKLRPQIGLGRMTTKEKGDCLLFSFLTFDEKLFLFAEYVDPGFVFEAVIAIEISRERK